MHIFGRGRRNAAQGLAQALVLAVPRPVRVEEVGADLLGGAALDDLGADGGAVLAQLAPQPPPADGLQRPALVQRLDEASVGDVDLLVGVDIPIDGQGHDPGGGVRLVEASPAELARPAAEGRQAEIVAAADALGVHAGQIVVARPGPDLGVADAIGRGHGRGVWGRGASEAVVGGMFSFSLWEKVAGSAV